MNKVKRALITGITGQDGSYLAELLLSKGYKVFGMARRTSTDPLVRIESIVLRRKVKLLNGDLRDRAAIRRVLEESKPDEIYNLAAQSDIGISFSCPEETFEINYTGFGFLVKEAVRQNKKVKIYQASSSELFDSSKYPQNEKSAFKPLSPYGKTKLRAYKDFVVNFREKHCAFICSGFTFNHESPRRGKHFVTRKITVSLAKIKLGLQDSFELGNINMRRDWGYAKDYVEAMWLMLQQATPRDFVVATGTTHSVREFFEATAKVLNLKFKWEGEGLNEVARTNNGKVILRINPSFYRPIEPCVLVGDASRANKILGWKPKHTFEQLVEMMVKSDFDYLRKNS